MPTIFLEVATPEKNVYSGSVQFCAAPGALGELGLLPGHAPLVARLEPGTLRVTDASGERLDIPFGGGVLEVMPDRISVFAETAEVVRPVPGR